MVMACSTGQQSNIQNCDQKTCREQTFGMYKCGWEDNIKVHLKKQGKRLWPRFVWLTDRNKLWVLMNMVISHNILQRQEIS